MTVLYRIARGLCKFAFFVVCPLRGKGMENIPEDGAAIVFGNHESFCDPIAIDCLIHRKVWYMAKKELFKNKLFTWALNGLGAFPVMRDKGDMEAVRRALEVLNKGNLFGIFPSGSRAFKGEPAFKEGVSFIAMRAHVPLIPVYIEGRARWFHPWHLTFGPAIDLSDLGPRMNREVLGQATLRLEKAVEALSEGKWTAHPEKSEEPVT